ncbi:MAG: aminotransferase class V-fold PLP-dependent enzyme [Ardenticatenaceae bacterium]|nr:aminotransferase class V-fold PLP-dependent enzyme [Ardenticatenaceae bacterium]MCB9005208.1 aminotransferase class V-fold PLP-dependent enzyme [Ardenticatenaceae bacterium]
MMAPKGAAFLYTRPERQALLEPLVVSWGYGDNWGFSFGSQYLDYLQWTGTHDPAAALAVPTAIEFMAAHDWDAVRGRCHALAQQTARRIGELTGLPSIYADDGDYVQLVAMELDGEVDTAVLKTYLYERHRVEIPLTQWQGRKFIRLSVQGYNTQEDMDALVAGLAVFFGD